MGDFPQETFDLVYLDPPFNSKANYNILFHEKTQEGQPTAQMMAFADTWHWDEKTAERIQGIRNAISHPAHKAITGLYQTLGNCGMMAYLAYMAERLVEIRRVTKKTGSVYLHCDPSASHYLKILMDDIFGGGNFRNEIVWCYTGPSNPRRWFPRKHDVILFYARSPEAGFNRDAVRIPYKQLNVQHREGRRGGIGGNLTAENVDEYRDKGKIPEDYWLEARDGMSPVGRSPRERTGYPTQKPLALLRRIILASSPPEGFVLDPFCGCGTTIVAAQELGRNWVGIDISPYAVHLVRKDRLKDNSIPIEGIPADLDAAREMAVERPFDFERWAVSCIPGLAPNDRQSGDGGIDGRGRIYDTKNSNKLIITQVKGGGFALSQFRDFLHVIEREDAALGVYVTLDPVRSENAQTEATLKGSITIGASTYPRVQLWSIHDYFKNRKPDLPPLANPWTGKLMQADLFTD